jgi:hypothetical protein
MGRLDQLSWADFTAPWETDVKAGLYWLQAALNLPLEPGSRVLVVSSGAAVGGSPMSGGYGGAKVGDEGANAYARAMSWRWHRTPSPRATAPRTDSAGRALLLASS